MYRLIAAVLTLMLSVGAVYAQAVEPKLAPYAKELDQRRERGEINYQQRSQMLRQAAEKLGFNSASDIEYWTYHTMLSAELDAGRMTWPQFEYAVAVKRNELLRQEQQSVPR